MLNVIVVAVQRNVTFIDIFNKMSLGQRESLDSSDPIIVMHQNNFYFYT